VESQISLTSEPDCLETEHAPDEANADEVVAFAAGVGVGVDANDAVFAAEISDAKDAAAFWVAASGPVEKDCANENGAKISTKSMKVTNAEKACGFGLPDGNIQYRIILWPV